MQIVVSSFDMVAGCGTAEPYTALALQTISRHFRCLHDAITGQIQVIQRSLGEQDTSPNGQGGIPRLRYVDQHLRQRRALQQFGVMRHAWRPQRGLPESSVSILRAWLFEHFLHPYVPQYLFFPIQNCTWQLTESFDVLILFLISSVTQRIQRKLCSQGRQA
jgi:hypothetical protein